MRPRVILLNGPPRCGKDTVGRIIDATVSESVLICKFAALMKERTHALYGLFGAEGRPLRADHFESRKDEGLQEFCGHSPRQAYIFVGEAMKAQHGQDYWGKLLRDQIERRAEEVAVVTDCGFLPESEVMIDRFGSAGVALIRVQRNGCDFSRDSRGMISLSRFGVREVDLLNTEDLELLEHRTRAALRVLDFDF